MSVYWVVIIAVHESCQGNSRSYMSWYIHEKQQLLRLRDLRLTGGRGKRGRERGEMGIKGRGRRGGEGEGGGDVGRGRGGMGRGGEVWGEEGIHKPSYPNAHLCMSFCKYLSSSCLLLSISCLERLPASFLGGSSSRLTAYRFISCEGDGVGVSVRGWWCGYACARDAVGYGPFIIKLIHNLYKQRSMHKVLSRQGCDLGAILQICHRPSLVPRPTRFLFFADDDNTIRKSIEQMGKAWHCLSCE